MGSIVNVSSGAAEEGGRFGTETVYAITKGGMQTMTRGLAADGGPYGIRVNTVSTGGIAGSKFMLDHPDQAEALAAGTAILRLPTKEEVAEAIAFMLSDRASGITGDILTVNAGFIMRS